MNTNKAAYWIILGVLALGLNSEYQHGNFAPLRRVAERADSAFCWVAARAKQTLDAAAILTNRGRFAANDLLAFKEETENAQAQIELLREQAPNEAELLRERAQGQVREKVKVNARENVRGAMRAQADVMRAQAEIQRAEVEQIRSRARSEFKLIRTADRRALVVCPKAGTRISVHAGARSADTSAAVEVGTTF
ncbi:MAG: hypothetical protein WCF61_15055 [Terriglobales bacterium]